MLQRFDLKSVVWIIAAFRAKISGGGRRSSSVWNVLAEKTDRADR